MALAFGCTAAPPAAGTPVACTAVTPLDCVQPSEPSRGALSNCGQNSSAGSCEERRDYKG